MDARVEDRVALVTGASRCSGWARPKTVAAAVTFLASDAASWISGVVLPVDGGVSGAGGGLVG